MSAEQQPEDSAKQEFAQKYAPNLDKVDLNLTGTETAQPDVSPEIIEREDEKEEQAKTELSEQAPDLELVDLEFLQSDQSEEERLFRIQFRQLVLAGHAAGKSLEEVYVDVRDVEATPEARSQALPLREIAQRIYRSADQRGGADAQCNICGKMNPRYEDNCPSFCPYGEQ